MARGMEVFFDRCVWTEFDYCQKKKSVGQRGVDQLQKLRSHVSVFDSEGNFSVRTHSYFNRTNSRPRRAQKTQEWVFLIQLPLDRHVHPMGSVESSPAGWCKGSAAGVDSRCSI